MNNLENAMIWPYTLVRVFYLLYLKNFHVRHLDDN